MLEPTILAVSVALASVVVMGFAIQRGGVCLVAALGELVESRRADQLLAIGGAALWAAGALALASLLGHAPPSIPETSWRQAALGGVLLGLGAFSNRACAFGTIAHIGIGDVAYLATPIGFLAGCLVLPSVWTSAAPPTMAAAVWATPLIAAPLIVIVARVAVKLALGRRTWRPVVWSQRHATTVIGLAFVAATLAVGPWTYTDVLGRLARHEGTGNALRLLLFAALLAGALLSGGSAGGWRLQVPAPAQVVRCFGGGLLLGMGSLLVPGGNDGLILIGLPSLSPPALLALASMSATVLLALGVVRGGRIARQQAFG